MNLERYSSLQYIAKLYKAVAVEKRRAFFIRHCGRRTRIVDLYTYDGCAKHLNNRVARFYVCVCPECSHSERELPSHPIALLAVFDREERMAQRSDR